MRILIVSEDIPYRNMGGLAKHALNLARALVRSGHQVDVLGGDQHPIDVAAEEGQFGGNFLGELSGHLAGWKERKLGLLLPPKRPWLAKHFARIILRHAPRYDVIHYHGHVPNVARYIPAHINFVQTRHDQGSDCVANTRFRDNAICNSIDPAQCAQCITADPNGLQRAISTMAVVRFRRQVAQGFQRHKTVFVSDMLQRNFARAMGPGSWGCTIHNFVDLDALKRAHERVRDTAGSNEIHVFVAGKLSPLKGIEPFLRELQPRCPPQMRVSIAGDGWHETRLRQAFENRQVRFLGWCAPDVTLRMTAAASLIVVPSICEDSCPSTILEGLLLGKPTFALAQGGAPEMKKYARAPEQLRLHADIPALVQDLITYDGRMNYEPRLNGPGGAEYAAEKLVQLYRLPAGVLLDEERPSCH